MEAELEHKNARQKKAPRGVRSLYDSVETWDEYQLQRKIGPARPRKNPYLFLWDANYFETPVGRAAGFKELAGDWNGPQSRVEAAWPGVPGERWQIDSAKN